MYRKWRHSVPMFGDRNGGHEQILIRWLNINEVEAQEMTIDM